MTHDAIGAANRWLHAAILVLNFCLPLATLGQPVKTAMDSGRTPIDPLAKEVIAKYIQACGGAAAMAKIVSQHSIFRVEMAGAPIVGKIEIITKDPGKIVMKTYFPGVGESVQGFDGKVAWSIDPKEGPKLLQGRSLEELREKALGLEIYVHLRFKSVQVLGKEQFAGTECYKLKLVKESGTETTEYYATGSGLMVGYSEVVDLPVGPVRATARLSDYKPFDGVLSPTKMFVTTRLFDQKCTIEKIEANTVDDSVFTLPKSIRALVASQALVRAK